MKKFQMFFLLAVFSLVTFTCANASSTATPILSNEEYRIGAGDVETSFLIQPTFTRGDAHSNAFLMQLGANYFLTDIIAPGLDFDFVHQSGTLFRLLPNVKAYYPTESRLMPYAQLGFGYMRDFDQNFGDFMLGIGADYMVANNVAVGAEFKFDLGFGSNTIEVVQLPIGFSIYFKY